jgi:two-component system, response regulator
MLLVENDRGDAELALRALRRTNVTAHVDVVYDGEAALEFMLGSEPSGTSRGEPPSVIVLDLKLPKVDGLEVLERLKRDARTTGIPIVVLSSSREDRDIADSYRRGANSYVVKPIDPDEYEQAVARLAHYWLMLNQVA